MELYSKHLYSKRRELNSILDVNEGWKKLGKFHHFHCLLCVWQSFIKEFYYYYYLSVIWDCIVWWNMPYTAPWNLWT